MSGNRCSGCAGGIPGIICPTSWDTLGDSLDGRVFIVRCDQCARFECDLDAAAWLMGETGWVLSVVPDPGYSSKLALVVPLRTVQEYERTLAA